jgi:hypothetical protein
MPAVNMEVTPAPGHGIHERARADAAEKGEDLNLSEAHAREVGDARHCRDPGPRGDAHHMRVGKGVAGHALQDRARHAQACPDHRANEHARQSQLAHDDARGPFGMPENRAPDCPRADVYRADRHPGHDGGDHADRRQRRD